MVHYKVSKNVLWILPGVCFLAGCAAVRQPPVMPPPEKKIEQPKGIQHKVRKSETLWRISRTYGVAVDDIIRANNIPDAASIEEGQLILVPGAAAVRDVPLAVDPAGKDNDFLWPLRGKVISYYREALGGSYNRGIDIKVSEDEFVRASRAGKVVLADRLPGYGYALILDHSDGFYTVYGHNEKILVALNDYVARGDRIAVPALSGGKLYGHFEIRKGDVPSNPLYYLP